VNVLFLTHRLPYLPNRGDRVRAYHILRALAGRAEVDLVSLVHDSVEEAHARDLDDVVRSVLTARVRRLRGLVNAVGAIAGQTPLTHALLDAPRLQFEIARLVARRRPDVVLAYCSGMARFALQPALEHRPLVLDLVDVDSRKWADLAEESSFPRSWVYRREARTLGAFEKTAAERAVATLVVNDREAIAARRLAPDANIQVVPNGIDLDQLKPIRPIEREARVVFCGVMSYEPNAQAALWFVQHVWPEIRAGRPGATLAIVGSDPPPRLRDACSGDPAITVTGSVPDVRPYLWSSSVSVAPLRVARGVQNKVLEAAAAGLPSVVTTAVIEGLPGEVKSVCAVADRPGDFAAAVLAMLRHSPEDRRRLMARADLRSLDWNARLAPLWSILSAARHGTSGVPLTGAPPRRQAAGDRGQVLQWNRGSAKP